MNKEKQTTEKEKLKTHTKEGYQKSDKAVHVSKEVAKVITLSNEQQVVCCFCESRKMQLISLLFNETHTRLKLVCETCGGLNLLDLGSGIETIPAPVYESKKEVNYLG